jgi:hypothetical protein
MALFPLLTGFISFYDSFESSQDKLSPVSVLKRPALSRPGLQSSLIEHRERLISLERVHTHDADDQSESDEGVRN